MSVLSKIKKGFAFFIYALLLFIFIVFGTIAGFFMQIRRQLPDLSLLKEYEPSLITMIYSSDGQPIAHFCLEKRVLSHYNAIPPHLIQAVVAVEDATFYKHKGLDWEGISRALFKNLKRRGLVEGGSTITQQLTRSLLLYPEKTIIRKIKEAFLAMEIEKVYSKEKILELYLNQIYLGNGAYGVESAAMTYFGRHVEELSLPDAALLAGLPKAPNTYNPYRHPDRALNRRNYVLRRMSEERYITQKAYQEAIGAPLDLVAFKKQGGKAPYFVEYVRKYLEETYGANALYRGGLKVYTTLDIEAQRLAENAIRQGIEVLDKRQGFRKLTGKVEQIENLGEILAACGEAGAIPGDRLVAEIVKVASEQALIRLVDTDYTGLLHLKDASWTGVDSFLSLFNAGDRVHVRIMERLHKTGGKGADFRLALDQEPKVQAAMLCIDPGNGHIKAMVGGYDFTTSKFNRAVQAQRQPGSSFKPFIYATALKQGMSLADIFIDSPVIYQDEKQDKDWKPVNYSKKFYGPTTIREALEQSRNVITIKMLKKVGIEASIETARLLGINSPLAPDLSLALGSSGVSLLELTSAYGVFATGGIRTTPIAILRVEGPDGRILEAHSSQAERVMDGQTCFLITEALRGVVDHGTGWKAKALGRPVAGKTGTTNNYIDAWFIGYTPKIVTGVWVGFDEYKTLGKQETGSKAAAPIWVDYMKGYCEGKPVQEFPVPAGIKFVAIDKKTGLLATPECPSILVEAFREGTEPREHCNAHQIHSDYFVSFDMDLSLKTQKANSQRRDINRPAVSVHSSD